jgi:hypothetical protein
VRIGPLGNQRGIGLLVNQQESQAASNDERLEEEPHWIYPPDACSAGPFSGLECLWDAHSATNFWMPKADWLVAATPIGA